MSGRSSRFAGVVLSVGLTVTTVFAIAVALDEAARREIEAALKETSGNVSESARVLGIARPNLWARMKALAIVPRR